MPDYCLRGDAVYKGADWFHRIEDAVLDYSNVSISDNEVNDFGDKAMVELRKNFIFIKNGRELTALRKVLKDLLSVRYKPGRIRYRIHLVDDTLVNAFTVGGHIIVTTGIIKAAGSVSAVASVIGHEIAHNERGHLKKLLKKIKVAQKWGHGEWGERGVILQQMITPAYNQPNEVEADIYGIDLCYAAGYDPRQAVNFWERLSRREYGEDNALMRFLRSHPFSKERANCLRKYIRKTYGLK